MEVLDEEGRLFGFVNVVDALVVISTLGLPAALLVGTDEAKESDLTSTRATVVSIR